MSENIILNKTAIFEWPSMKKKDFIYRWCSYNIDQQGLTGPNHDALDHKDQGRHLGQGLHLSLSAHLCQPFAKWFLLTILALQSMIVITSFIERFTELSLSHLCCHEDLVSLT